MSASKKPNPLLKKIGGGNSNNGNSLNENVEDLFQRADLLLFKEKQPERAETLYRQILDLQPENVDAINSMA